ncbi:MAG TPA: prephenate dehydratase [Candidatus Eisenbacteria bacterium]|nr:prephenate dehydratase [Candidatus Eisenbacteria bacterium]
MSRNESVDALRKRIDQVDEKLVALLNERAALAQKIGLSKSLNNQEVYAPNREKEVLRRVATLNAGPLPEPAVRAIFREIISASRSLEEPTRVVYLGPEATYTHAAAREKFGSSAHLDSCATIADVFQEVAQGRAIFGVVPIENSTEGAVGHTLDLLVESDARICAELFLEIHHCLLSRNGDREKIRRIVSHPHALAQCRRWLSRHFPHAELEEVPSTALAALMASSEPGLAAISSAVAKEVYDLQVIAANIEDHAHNITRFVVIGGSDSRPSGDDKTSLVFSVKDEPGILHRMLAPFAKSRINLTKIESRPIKNKPWEYMFFIDIKGHEDESRVRRAIDTLRKKCLFLKVLGSYPSGV